MLSSNIKSQTSPWIKKLMLASFILGIDFVCGFFINPVISNLTSDERLEDTKNQYNSMSEKQKEEHQKKAYKAIIKLKE